MSTASPEGWHKAGMKTVELYTLTHKGKPKKISRQEGLCVFFNLCFRDGVRYMYFLLRMLLDGVMHGEQFSEVPESVEFLR